MTAWAAELGVSIFLPTHTLGRETLQDPVRLKNLVTVAEEISIVDGGPVAEVEAMLAPAMALVKDYDF